MRYVRFTIIRLFFRAAVAAMLASCALGDGNPGSQNGLCGVRPENIDTFVKSGLSGELQNSCKSCHTVAASRAPSPFADSDSGVAYPYARRFADLSSPGNSFFITRMRSGHECGSRCSELADTFLKQIGAWAAEEAKLPSVCEGGSGSRQVVETTSSLLSTSLALNDTKLLKFDLGQGTPSFAKAAFQVSAKRYTNAIADDLGSFLLYNPTFASEPRPEDPTANLKLVGIGVVVNGVSNLQHRAWAGIQWVQAPLSFNFNQSLSTLPASDLTQLVRWEKGDGDQLAFQLVIERTTADVSVPKVNPYVCKAQGAFNTVAGLFSTAQASANGQKCIDCHDSGHPTFKLVVTAGTTPCQEAKRVASPIPGNSADARLLTYPQSANHNPQITLNATDINNIKAWLDLEK